MGKLVKDFASGMKHLLSKQVNAHGDDFQGSEKKKSFMKGKMVSISGPACLEWYVADFAFLLLGMINVSSLTYNVHVQCMYYYMYIYKCKNHSIQ